MATGYITPDTSPEPEKPRIPVGDTPEHSRAAAGNTRDDGPCDNISSNPRSEGNGRRKGEPAQARTEPGNGVVRGVKRCSHAVSPERDSDKEDPSPPTAKQVKKNNESGLRYACPFFKMDSHKHRECARYEFRRVKDVKQHLNRKHQKTDLYCPRCFAIFPFVDERDEHIRHVSCPPRDDRPQFDGISEEQRKQLNHSSKRGVSATDQWFEMWDVVFPNTLRPRSCYMGNYAEEFVPVLLRFWDDKGATIIRENNGDGNLNLINRVMRDFLDRFVGEVSGELNAPEASASTRDLSYSTLTPGGYADAWPDNSLGGLGGQFPDLLNSTWAEMGPSRLSTDDQLSLNPECEVDFNFVLNFSDTYRNEGVPVVFEGFDAEDRECVSDSS